MKKLLLIVLCCICLCGCGNKEEINALKGTWIKNESKFLGVNVTYLEFDDQNKFEYKVRVYNWDNDKSEFEEGFHIYQGTYKLNDNIIYLTVKKVDDSFPMNECEICNPTPPPQKLIIDFDKMKICNRDDGIDCEVPFSKDT